MFKTLNLNKKVLLLGSLFPVLFFQVIQLLRFGYRTQSLRQFLDQNLFIYPSFITLVAGFLSTSLLLIILSYITTKNMKISLVIIYLITYPIFILGILFIGLLVPFIGPIIAIILHLIPTLIFTTYFIFRNRSSKFL